MQVEKGKVVMIHFTLKDPDSGVIDTSEGRPPLPYLHGFNNLVAGVEEALEGLEAGATIQVVVPPEKGYGPRSPDSTAEVPRSAFPQDAHIFEGMQFMAEDDQGNQGPIWISEVRAEIVVIDRNHPLAGKDLHFDIEVVRVREATAEELAHGHPHGEGGHDHSHDESGHDNN